MPGIIGVFPPRRPLTHRVFNLKTPSAMNAALLCRSFAYLALFTAAVLWCGCDSGDPLSLSDALGGAGTITTGPWTQLVETTIPAGGGTVSVPAAGPIGGARITVPVGSYSTSQRFVVSTAEITGHRLGAHFSPVSPLISVSNGGGFSNTMMRLRIPLTIPASTGVMAFYYDPRTGELEGIPTIARGADYLEVGVRHFSLIVLSAFQKEALIDGGMFDTDFDPKVNGWSFENLGTYAQPTGICAGMSIGAAYFFRQFKATVRVQSWFDNHGLWWPTPDFWQDDAGAIKFTTQIQRTFVQNRDWSSYTPIIDAPEEDRFWNIIYSLLVINQPQVVYLRESTGANPVAHAVLATGYTISSTGATLTIYDPNYPDNTTQLTYDLGTNTFAPFTSSTSAEALRQGHTFNFGHVAFMPLSTFAPAAELDALWGAVQDGTIGTALTPQYTLQARDAQDPDAPPIELLDASTGKTNHIPYDQIRIQMVQKNPSENLRLSTVFETAGQAPTVFTPAGDFSLESPNQIIGMLVDGQAQGSPGFLWADFHWYKMTQSAYWIEPKEAGGSINQQMTFTAHRNGAPPSGMKYVWNFGDGTPAVTVNNDSTVSHAWSTAGSYAVKVTVSNATTGEVAGSAEATASIGLWTRMEVAVMGNEFGDPTSTIMLTNDESLSEVKITNSTPPNTTNLTWNGRRFHVLHSYTLSHVSYTITIDGELSPDGKTVTTVKGTVARRNDANDWWFDSEIDAAGIPITITQDEAIGGELTATAAHAAVRSVKYRTRIKYTDGSESVVEIKSIDWTSPQTRLKVWFFR